MTLSELEEQARQRKERLAQWKLKSKRKEVDEDDDDDDDEANSKNKTETSEFPKPIFRNYKPTNIGQLSNAIVLPKPKLIDVKTIIDERGKNETNENDNENATSITNITEDVDLLSLAPRKPDWDLKRDVEKKLKRLEKRTARAIAELTRERLLGEQTKSQNNLAEVVATTSRLNEDLQDDDD